MGYKFGKNIKLFGIVGAVSAALALIAGGVVLAAACADAGIERGPNNGGGSVTNGHFRFWQDNNYMYIDVSFAPVSYRHYGFGCNENYRGQGYLVTGVQMHLTGPNGYSRWLKDCTNHRMSRYRDDYWKLYTFVINKNGLDDGWYCIGSNQYWRNHYCSISYSNYSSSGSKCFYIHYSWSASGWSWNNGSILYPGDTIHWTHQVKNNGPSTVKNGDLTYNVDAWDRYNDGRVIRDIYSASGNVNAGRVGSGRSVYWYGSKGPLSQDDVGKQYCQRVHWHPQSTSNAAVGYASWSCTKVPYDYDTIQHSSLAQINGQEVSSNKVVKPTQSVRAHYQLENYSWSHTKTLAISWSNGIKVKRGDSQIGSLASSGGTFREGYFYPGAKVNSRTSSDLPSHYYESVPESVNGNRVDADDKICAWMQTDNRNYAHNYGAGGRLGTARYTEDCATVPYHYPGCSAYGFNSNCNNTWNSPDPSFNCAFEGSCEGETPKTGAGVNAVVNNEGDDFILDGQNVKFNYTITNYGPSKTKSIGYKIYIFRMGNGYSIDQAEDRVSRLFGYNRMSEVPISVRTRSAIINPNSSKRISSEGPTYSGNVQLGNPSTSTRSKVLRETAYTNLSGSMSGEVGDLICSYIVLDKNWAVYEGKSSNTMLASNLKCVSIGKRPQMQINGSDSYASGGFVGWSPANNMRGSYTQYAQITNSGVSSDFGSAGYTWNYHSQTARLIYANARNADSPSSIGDISAGRLSYGGVSSIVNQLQARHGSNVEFHNGGYDIGSDIINADASNMRVIVAKGDINIARNVSRIDAVLIATGRVNTCAGSGTSGTNGSLSITGGCANRLVINGAFISGSSPVFHRTWGGGNVLGVNQGNNYSEGATAEKINYTPNIWLNANEFTSGTSVQGYTITTQTSLPVRY